MKIGFTGTRKGMTADQKQSLFHIFLYSDIPDKFDFHHGNCVGADEQAAEFVKNLRLEQDMKTWVIAHPPINTKYETKFQSDEYKTRRQYIPRDHDIVDESDMMLAASGHPKEFLRSGTWATIRYARKQKKNLIIVFPDGSFKCEIMDGSFEIRSE